MPGPMLSAPVAAAQTAQINAQETTARQSQKQGPSKFDAALADGAQKAQMQGASATNATQAPPQAQGAASNPLASGQLQVGQTQAAVASTKAQAASASASANHIDDDLGIDEPVSADADAEENVSEVMSSLSTSGSESLLPVRSQSATPIVERMTEGSEPPGMLVQLLGDLERGGGLLDQLISQGLNKQLSNSELLALQASMYKYTQELDLTGKVVQEATTSLKDTLKTQV